MKYKKSAQNLYNEEVEFASLHKAQILRGKLNDRQKLVGERASWMEYVHLTDN